MSVYVASAVAALQSVAQNLLVAFGSVARVGIFSSNPRDFALVWGILFVPEDFSAYT